MSTSISAPAGFFQADTVGPDTATDLVSAVNAAAANVTALGNAVTASAASATAAAASASTAAASATTATTQATSATSQATTATGAASAASSSASAASTSATAANGSATTAASSATTAGTSATSAGTSATNAANSATAAASSATSASTSATAAITAGYGNVGRNLLHNSTFLIQQRGGSPFTSSGYTLDRWKLATGAVGDSASVSQVTISDAQRGQIGDEAATSALTNAFVGGSAAAAAVAISQPIESVRRTSGKTVTVSFWAAAGSGTPKIGVSIDQIFGTGGSPSSNVNGAGQSVTLSTTMARYTLTFAVPSAIGQTFGTTAGTDYAQLNLWYSSGSTDATRAGSVGVQSNTISVWGVQLEIGSAATALEKLDYNLLLAQCQRFYCAIPYSIGGYGAGGAFSPVGPSVPFPVPMRAVPTVNAVGPSYTNASALTVPGVTTQNCNLGVTVTVGGQFIANATFTASADL